ncbi:MAG: DnaJ family domain-containing protein [Desulfobacterales bacterium]
MITGFEKIVEERIRAAQRQGAFDNLPGAGKPLTPDDLDYVPEDLRMAYRMLRNADCLPPEIEMKKEIDQVEDLLRVMPDTEEKYRTLKRLNFLILKLNTARGASIVNELPQHYAERVADRLSKPASRSKA